MAMSLRFQIRSMRLVIFVVLTSRVTIIHLKLTLFLSAICSYALMGVLDGHSRRLGQLCLNAEAEPSQDRI